jgi:DNA-binding CsgD family transcriptional regulator
MPLDVADVDLPLVLVMMGRRQVCSPLGMELLASHHGLTFAESRVLRALVDNLSPREIAASHGVAIATIRTQISAVRDKLGVRSIDALLLRAAAVPPLTGRH